MSSEHTQVHSLPSCLDLQMSSCSSSPRLSTGLTKIIQQHMPLHMNVTTAAGAMTALLSVALQ